MSFPLVALGSVEPRELDTSPERLDRVAHVPHEEVRVTEQTLSLEVLLPEDDEAGEWQERALCAQTDPESFFPEKGGSTREAKRICTGCEVRTECLEYALVHDERFGIWGGLSERERRRLRRRAV